MSWKPTRRRVLRGLLGGAAVSVALPALPSLAPRSAWAQQSSFPNRFVLFFWGNGVLLDRWLPIGQGEGDAWQLSEELAPLAPVKDKITVVSGTEVRVPNTIPHWSGAAGLLSGIAPLGEEGDNTFAGPSIDQIIAAEMGDTLYRSLEVGAHPGGQGGVSRNGPHSVNPAERSPHAVFERLFGAGFTLPGDEAVIDPRLALRRSVLDAVHEQGKALRSRAGAEDAIRLDQHFQWIRDLEIRLGRMEANPPSLESCSMPAEPPLDDFLESISQTNRLLCDLVALALACDLTRVATNCFTHPVDNYLFPGTEAGHHQLTHDELDPQPQVHDVLIQIADELRYFIEVLDSVPEGEGTLLQHCGMLATTDVSYGRTHSLDEFPIILAGGASGALKMGMHYRSETRENASSVMLSLIRAMGIPAAEYGAEDARVTEGLGGIEA